MPPEKRPLLILSWFAWSLLTWLALAAAAFGLIHNLDIDPEIPTWHWWLVLTMPFLAVLFGWRALRSGSGLWRVTRVIFWMFTAAGAALFAALLQGQWEVYSHHRAEDGQLLMFTAFLPGLALVLAIIGERRAGGLKPVRFHWLLDLPLGIICLCVVLVAAYFAWLKMDVEPLRRAAAQRWADIGRPMPEFEQSLQPVQENASLGELTADLKPFGIVTLYKTPDNLNTIKTPPELMDLYVATSTIPGDRIRNVPKATAWLDARADDFNRLYQGILQRDPPVWTCNPSDGFLIRVPNFAAERTLAEFICSDAYHRLQKNDIKGAADAAIAAGLRIVANMEDQPLMVSNMINASIESMYAPVLARLPAQPNDMQQLAQEVVANRRQFARTVQWEAWQSMHYLETGRHDLQEMRGGTFMLLPVQPLPAWLGSHLLYPFYCDTLGRVRCSKDWLYEADVVRIAERAPDLAATDLGAGEMDASFVAHRTPDATNWTHPWLRINFMLLIREQAVIIRYARAQMQAGKTGDLGSQPSVVIPGAKWQITGDAAANSVTMRLDPVPAWASDTSITGAVFFMIPLDGRRPWQLQASAAKQP